jgi:ketosteroid isomerase-like protein
VIDPEEWRAAWNSRDDERIIALTAPDIEVNAATLGVEARHYKGHDGMREWLEEVRHRFHAETKVTEVQTIEGEAAIVCGVLHVEDEKSGQRVDQGFAILAHLGDDDKATWLATFITPEEAREAYKLGVTGPQDG